MKYAAYKKKMQKVSKVLNVLYKLRFPIIGTVVLAIASSLVLTGLNGQADKVTLKETEIPYGTEPSAIGSAFFGGAEVEYSEYKKNNWTSEVPTYVGKYEVRAVSTNGFGQKTYSQSVVFDILPKPLEIVFVPTEITYGSEIHYTHNLEAGERLSNFTITYAENYYGENPFGENESFNTSISYDASTLKIYNEKEEDVTACYTIEPISHTLKIKKRDLHIIYKDSSKFYDGAALGTDLHFVSDETPLAEGDSFRYKDKKEIVDPGILDITKDYEIIGNSSGKSLNRTAFYNVTFNTPELTILKRELTLSTNDINTTYNGYAFSSDSTKATEGRLLTYNLSGNLLEGHTFVINEFLSEGLYKPVSGSSNIVDYTIYDSNGEDVTEKYYNVKEEFGSVNIEKHNLTLSVFDEVKEYDGQILYGGYSLSEMPLTDQLIAEVNSGPNSDCITDIGTTTYGYDFTIVNEEFGDVTDCYNISFKDNKQTGTLTIKEIPLLLKSNDIGKTYDGVPFSSKGEGINKLFVEDVNNRILEGHKLVTEFTHENDRFVNDVNSYTYDIIDESTNESVLHLYDVSEEYGQITTSKRQMTISYANKEAGSNGNYSFIYDGTAKTANYEIISGYEGEEALAKDDVITFTNEIKTITNVGSIDNFDDEHTFEITYKDQDVSGYYDIELIDASVEITKRIIKVKLNKPLENKTYDGKTIEIPENYVEFYCEDGFEIDDKFTITHTYEETSFFRAGTHSVILTPNISFKNGDTLDENGFDIRENFSFEYEIAGKTSLFSPGSQIKIQDLTISKRPLTLSTYTASKVYDGTKFDSNDAAIANDSTQVWSITEGEGLAEGDSITVTSVSEITNVGSVENHVSFDIYNKDLVSVSDCYELDSKMGKLTITQADLFVKYTGESSYIYDNEYHTIESDKFEVKGLCDNHYFSLSLSSQKFAGTYNFASMYSFQILDENGDDVTANYKTVELVTPTEFVIAKREANVYLKDLPVDLNFGFADYPGEFISEGTNFNNAINDDVTLSWGPDASNEVKQGKYPTLVVEYKGYENGILTDKTDNYSINIVYANLSKGITNIKVHVAKISEYATGKNIKPDPSYYASPSLPAGYYFGNVEFEEQTCIEVQDYTFNITGDIKIYNSKGEDVTSFFNITEKPSTFTLSIINYILEIDVTNKQVSFDNEDHFIGLNYDVEEYLISQGHHIEIVGQEPIRLPGKKTFTINGPEDIVVKNSKGEDVTKLYEIVIRNNVLDNGSTTEVMSLDIQVETPTISKTFDGLPIQNTDYENLLTTISVRDGLNGSMVALQNIYSNRDTIYSCKYKGLDIQVKYPILPDYGYHKFEKTNSNICELAIFDKDGSKITNYEEIFNVSYRYGDIRIDPLIVYYSTVNSSKNYDGRDVNTSDNLMDQTNVLVKLSLNNLPESLKKGVTEFTAFINLEGNLFLAGTYSAAPQFTLVFNGEDLVAKGDVVFVASSSSEVTQTIRAITLNISNMGGVYMISKREPQAPEKLYVSGLLSGDILYVGNEEYNPSTLDYQSIGNMDYGTVEGYTYGPEHVDSSIFSVYKTVYGQQINVTNCYNINFHWDNVVVKVRS